MSDIRKSIDLVNQLNEGWWPSKANPAAPPAQSQNNGGLTVTAKQDERGVWRWYSGNTPGRALTKPEIDKMNRAPTTQTPKAADPHVSQVVQQLKKLVYQLKANPNASDAAMQIDHYVKGLKNTAAKYNATQWMDHLNAIEKNVRDPGPIQQFITDYEQAMR